MLQIQTILHYGLSFWEYETLFTCLLDLLFAGGIELMDLLYLILTAICLKCSCNMFDAYE